MQAHTHSHTHSHTRTQSHTHPHTHTHTHTHTHMHADLKPDNVLLKVDPLTYRVIAKLADFGLSAVLGPQATHVSNFRYL